MQLGILGGTFDPVHRGHIACARDSAHNFDLSKVLLVLSARPPHKPGQTPAPVQCRMEMLRLATAEDPRLEPSALEAGRPGLSYTYDTLKTLRTRYPGCELYLILGVDAFVELDTWYRAGEILELCHLLVTGRPGHELDRAGGRGSSQPRGKAKLPPFPAIAALSDACYDSEAGCYLHSSGHRVIGQQITALDISSTEIRRRARQDGEIADLCGPAVARYILEHGLYRAVKRS